MARPQLQHGLRQHRGARPSPHHPRACGPTAYANAFDLIHRRTASQPNAGWQADHTPLALWVLDQRGTPARPWLTLVMDEYRWAIAGAALTLRAPWALQTALVVRQAIWRKGEPGRPVCGIPAAVETSFRRLASAIESLVAGLEYAARLTAVVRSTGGNVRLLHRLLTQVERILAINAQRTVTKEVVEAAREGLIIGPL